MTTSCIGCGGWTRSSIVIGRCIVTNIRKADDNGFSTVVAKLSEKLDDASLEIELRYRGLTQRSSSELIGRLLWTVCRTIREFEAVYLWRISGSFDETS